ncbi:MAG: FkbM family methyltransferase [Pseudomonadota bacterium]
MRKEDRFPTKKMALEVLREREVPVETVLDVGVLKGTPELIRAYPNVKHVLFEPVQEFSDVIARVYGAVDHELHCVAVSDKVGETGLRLSSSIDGVTITHSRMVESGESGSHANLRQVPATTLDHFLGSRSFASPYLLKIDIDGQELRVLRGAQDTLKRCSVVIVECSKRYIAERLAFLWQSGFELFDLCEPCYYDSAFWQCDAVFIQSDLFPQHFKELKGKVLPGLYEVFRG